MSDFATLAKSRRSIRRYTDQPVERAVIEHILEIAHWSPSAHNRQPFRFAVITTPPMKEQLARAMGNRLRQDLAADNAPVELIEKDVARSYARITGAAVLICLCMTLRDMDTYPDEKRSWNEQVMAIQSTAMAGQNLLLAAHELGLGACWMCAPLFCPEVVQAALDLPSDWQPQALITLGYPAEERQRDRKPTEELTLWL